MTARSDPHGVICLAVYRPDVELLSSQLDSIRTQSLENWTCLIGIDGHDSAAEESVRALVGEDARFVIHAFPDNVGFYRNFERLLSLVEPDAAWVALSDQDDYWYPEKLDALCRMLGDAVLVTGSARLVTTAGVDLGVTRRANHGLTALMIDNQVTGSMAVFRTCVLEYALPFPAPTDASYHDHWLAIVASSMGVVAIDSRVLQDYVQHDANVIGEELSGAAVRQRTDRLVSAGGSGVRGALRYLAQQRWGWRVTMARTALDRVPDVSDGARRELEPFGRGTLSMTLARRTFAAVVRKHVPAGRAAALVAGAAAARSSDFV